MAGATTFLRARKSGLRGSVKADESGTISQAENVVLEIVAKATKSAKKDQYGCLSNYIGLQTSVTKCDLRYWVTGLGLAQISSYAWVRYCAICGALELSMTERCIRN